MAPSGERPRPVGPGQGRGGNAGGGGWAGGEGGRLYLEGLGAALTVHLLRTQGTTKRAPAPHKGGLAPVRLRRVVEFITAHLEEDIALPDLAAVAELST